MLNEKSGLRKFASEKAIHMINVLPEPVKSISEPEKPDVIKPRITQLVLPSLQFSEPAQSQLDIPFDDSSYELPSELSHQHENIFDPKLRKKLIEAQRFNVLRQQEKVKSWTEADGRTFVDMGDGMCLVSMPQADSSARGTNWGMTRCGKTNSEKMMDNVNADFESRRHPPNKKDQQ